MFYILVEFVYGGFIMDHTQNLLKAINLSKVSIDAGSSPFGAIIVDKDGKIIGTKFPEDMNSTTLYGFYARGGKGDKKLVYRTEVIRQYPEYPLFEGERYVSLGYKYQLIDQDYELLTMNESLVVVEYQADGSSRNMYKQYWNNPKGFAFIRKADMKLMPGWIRKFRACIHYVSSSLRAKNKYFISESPLPLATLLAIIPGFILYKYTEYKVKSDKKFKLKHE